MIIGVFSMQPTIASDPIVGGAAGWVEGGWVGRFLPAVFNRGVWREEQGVFLLDKYSGMLRCREGFLAGFLGNSGAFRLSRGGFCVGFSHSWFGGGRLP